MKPVTRLLGVALAATVAAPGAASAAITTGTPHPLCIFWGAFSACASVQIDVSGLVTVKNLSPGTAGNTNYQLTGFGFYYLDINPTTGALSQNSFPTGWAFDADGGLTGVLGGESWIGGASTTQGVNDAIGPNGTLVFTFDIDTTPDWSKMYFGWRGQAWEDLQGEEVGSGSIKCFQTGEASEQGEPDVSFCEPPTIVPEPGSMLLLATGLIGMAGAGVIRRRKSRNG